MHQGPPLMCAYWPILPSLRETYSKYFVDMLLNQEDLEELRQLHFEEFNEVLTMEEAEDMGFRLMLLYELFCQTDPQGSPLAKIGDSGILNSKR